MAEEIPRSRLGRGIAALIGDVDVDIGGSEAAGGMRRIPVEFLRRNPRNPRTNFPEAELEELAASIRHRGIIQPVVVRPVPNLPDAFEIVAGERRWRAAQRAGLHDLPVVVIEADDRSALEIAIIENVQRTDLNALEEAAGYEALITQHGYTQSEMASTLGRSRSHVANTLRLLKLPELVRDMLHRGELSAGHARALLSVDDPEAVARRVVDEELNVRDVERLSQDEKAAVEAEPPRTRLPRRVDAETRALEEALQDALGLLVRIDHRGQAGEVRIRYKDVDQLDALCRRLRPS